MLKIIETNRIIIRYCKKGFCLRVIKFKVISLNFTFAPNIPLCCNIYQISIFFRGVYFFFLQLWYQKEKKEKEQCGLHVNLKLLSYEIRTCFYSCHSKNTNCCIVHILSGSVSFRKVPIPIPTQILVFSATEQNQKNTNNDMEFMVWYRDTMLKVFTIKNYTICIHVNMKTRMYIYFEIWFK